MAVILSKELFKPRTIPCGYGVKITFAPFGFADYREAEARSRRLAADRLTQPEALAMDQKSDEDLGPEFQERLFGLASEVLIDSLVMKFATGWEGVEDETKAPLPLNPENWQSFRDEFPTLVDILDRSLGKPMQVLADEGNV
jgi:hypothetical protein